MVATGNQKDRSIVRCEMYFDVLNRLHVDHECERRTDRQTDGRT